MRQKAAISTTWKYTRAVWKVSDLWPGKLYYLGDGIGTLIPFKVGSLRLHTLSPPMLLLPKTLLEGFFWNGVHLRRRVLHYLFSTLKTGSFQCRLQFWKQPEVARSHVWRVGRMVNDWNSMFRQEILDQVRWMCWSIVMMQLPVFRSHSAHVQICTQNFMCGIFTDPNFFGNLS